VKSQSVKVNFHLEVSSLACIIVHQKHEICEISDGVLSRQQHLIKSWDEKSKAAQTMLDSLKIQIEDFKRGQSEIVEEVKGSFKRVKEYLNRLEEETVGLALDHLSELEINSEQFLISAKKCCTVAPAPNIVHQLPLKGEKNEELEWLLKTDGISPSFTLPPLFFASSLPAWDANEEATMLTLSANMELEIGEPDSWFGPAEKLDKAFFFQSLAARFGM
jgi:hypothetical protein